MTLQEKRIRCLELAVQAVKGRTTNDVGEFTVAIAKKFEQYVTQEVNQKPVNLNKSTGSRKSSTR